MNPEAESDKVDDTNDRAMETVDIDNDDDNNNKETESASTAVSKPDSSAMTNSHHGIKASPFSAKWTRTVDILRIPLMKFLLWLTNVSATYPRITMASVTVLSFAVLILGILTGFQIDVDEDVLWTPENSLAIQHRRWVADESGYPQPPRNMILFFHADGGNVLTNDNIVKVFQGLDAVRNLPGYQDTCVDSTHVNHYGVRTCFISGVTDFWYHNTTLFENEALDDNLIIETISAQTYPDGRPVSTNSLFGRWERDENDILTSAQSMSLIIYYDDADTTIDFEELALEAVLDLDEQWQNDDSTSLRLETFAERSFSDEFGRAIVDDIPLVPVVFIVMSIFTSAIFFKRDRVHSRSLLGFNAVLAVLLSLMTGYGLLFLCKVPMTSMTQILPFVIFGIGLDDAFIITGSFMRTNPMNDPIERIKDTIDDVGLSITLTTLTSALAFALGSTSTIPAVYWLCQYAFPTIVIVYLYQITFFVAAIVLDERRVSQNRQDCCSCIKVDRTSGSDTEANTSSVPKESTMDRFMKRYAEFLLQTWVKAIVIVSFAVLLVVCAFSASKLTQEFKFTDVLPSDSYITDFQNNFDLYTTSGSVNPWVIFRNVDQSDPEIQQQMHEFMQDIYGMKAVQNKAVYFWLEDFEKFVNETDGLEGESFNAQLDTFLASPIYKILYADDIVRNADGDIVTSRTFIFMDNLDLQDVREQIDTLVDQREVTANQPINDGKSEDAFFLYDNIFDIWTFYEVTAKELIFSTLTGIVSVTGVTLLLIPHWSAALFVLPLICILYVDLLGVMQWGGVHINAVSYIALVMSIGLLVDFVLHILLRFYESSGNRREKTIEMLHTMGSSILTGSLSTFLGTLPLAFSTSAIFVTIFVAFFGLVTIGCLHGLVLLPVVLSMIGPEDEIRSRAHELAHRDESNVCSEEMEKSKNSDTTAVNNA